MTPVFADYLEKSDLAGYMKAVWKNARKSDIGSMHALLYLAVRCSDQETVISMLGKLSEKEDEFGIAYVDMLMEEMNQWSEEDQDDDDKVMAWVKTCYIDITAAFPDHPDYEEIYGRNHNDLLRAYLNGIGKNEEDNVPDATGVEADPTVEVPEDTLRYWKLYYTRHDASSSMMGIYEGAIPYAKQGHPFAMFIVGYILSSGVRTRYSYPSVVYLESHKEEALPWLEKAADAGIKEALPIIIQNYEWLADRGTEEEKAAARRKADEWINKGAGLNDETSVTRQFDKLVEEEKWEEAFPLLVRLAEEFKSRHRRLELAEWYLEGKGCEKDPKKAFEQVEYVYNHSSVSPYNDVHELAAEKLEEMLSDGIGCERDFDRAAEIRRQLRSDMDDLEETLSRDD